MKVAAPSLEVGVELFHYCRSWFEAHPRASGLADCFTGFIQGFLRWEDIQEKLEAAAHRLKE